jgi:VWFA-related protein
VCAIALGAAAAAPIAARPGPADRNTADTTVRVTAVVTDRRGQLVRNLKPADFELLEDGRPQTLEAADYVARAPAGPRTIAFLLDEFHTSAADSAAVRDNLLHFVDTRLRPGDSAVLVKPLDPLMAIKPTDDREAIRRTIASFEGRKGDYAPRTPFERNYMAQAPEAVRWARAQIVTSALRAIGNVLTQDGRGQVAIVLVSDGFERGRTSRDVPANLQSVVRVINRADAAVYAFTPSTPVAEADGTAEAGDTGVQALRRLAKDTGGDLFAGPAAFEAGFARMASDLDAHYVLSYRASHGNDGRFHALEVGVKRPNAVVRTRSGYVAPLSETLRAELTPPSTVPVRVMRRSSMIQSWTGITPSDNGADVMLTWSPVSVVTSARSHAASVVITASAADGTVLFDAAVAPVGEARGESLPDHASFAAPLGPVRVDMKILDAKGVVLDTDARDVAVARPRPGAATIYSPGVLRARSAREFREFSTDPAAPATPLREFRRTERLIVRVPAVDAAGVPAPVTATLLNRWRQPMRAVEPMPERWGSVTQFDLPLASLAPGEYTLRVSVVGPAGNSAEYVTFKVQG